MYRLTNLKTLIQKVQILIKLEKIFKVISTDPYGTQLKKIPSRTKSLKELKS